MVRSLEIATACHSLLLSPSITLSVLSFRESSFPQLPRPEDSRRPPHALRLCVLSPSLNCPTHLHTCSHSSQSCSYLAYYGHSSSGIHSQTATHHLNQFLSVVHGQFIKFACLPCSLLLTGFLHFHYLDLYLLACYLFVACQLCDCMSICVPVPARSA